MALHNHYFYDEVNCDFVPVKYDPVEQFFYNAAVWILTGVVVAGIGIIFLSSYIGTPSEIALKAENEVLIKQLEQNKEAITQLDEKISSLSEQDNEIYRSVLGMEEISYDERLAGIGGSEEYPELDVYNSSTSDLLKWTASKIDNLERRISIQKLSFEEIKVHYNENKEKMKNIPAIKPVNGILLSGFGIREHPILKYRRMHHGLDFRASVGTPVHATGDGKVEFYGRQGNLGLILIIDHGHGYETMFAHLSSVPDDIKIGKEVKRGETVAFSGDTGLSEGPHLHYEIRVNGRRIDPINYLFADTSPEEYQLFKKIAAENTKSLD